MSVHQHHRTTVSGIVCVPIKVIFEHNSFNECNNVSEGSYKPEKDAQSIQVCVGGRLTSY